MCRRRNLPQAVYPDTQHRRHGQDRWNRVKQYPVKEGKGGTCPGEGHKPAWSRGCERHQTGLLRACGRHMDDINYKQASDASAPTCAKTQGPWYTLAARLPPQTAGSGSRVTETCGRLPFTFKKNELFMLGSLGKIFQRPSSNHLQLLSSVL